MGYYIQGPAKGKAEYLEANHGAEILPEPPPWQTERAIVCVIDNGPFEAAGYAYDERELEAFKSPDRDRPQRQRTWLLMDRGLAESLSGFTRNKE